MDIGNIFEIIRYKNDINKVEELAKFTRTQLDHYSKFGKRHFSLESMAKKIGMSCNTTSKYLKLILGEIFKNKTNANTIYDMIFGKVMTSYQDLQRKCQYLNVKLLTTPFEWFGIVKNRGDISIQNLSIKIQFECGHITHKMIHNLKKRGCGECSLKENQKYLHGRLEYNQVLELARERNLLLVSSYQDLEDSIIMTRTDDKKKPSDAIILWRCKKCKRLFKNRYSNVKWHGSGCSYCSIGKEQRITHLYCEYIFNQEFEINKPLDEIFYSAKIPNKLSHHSIHIDSFSSLNFQDQIIKLGIEYNGLQHNNSKEGWEWFKVLSHNKCTLNEWKDLIKRDLEKIKLFRNFNNENYFLIVVPHRVRRNDRLYYIIKQFKLLTGISIKKKFIDWKRLYFTKNL